MKRTALLLVFAIAVLTGILWPRPAAASANDFSFSDFTADYYLTRDAEQHSHLRVTEHLQALFPAFNQNHGIERAIPESYDGHRLHLTVATVTDESGRELPHSTYESNGNKVLRIGDPDTYVHGPQSYTISYSMTDVTKNFADHDELFWNTNGVQWQQPFGSLTARLHLDKATTTASNNTYRCVLGYSGAQESCNPKIVDNPDGSRTIAFTAPRSLQPGENLSFVAGFTAQSFAAYTPTTWEKIFPALLRIWLIANVVFLIICIIWSTRIWSRFGRPPQGRGTIVPEYLPPKEMSVLIAGPIVRRAAPATTAQIIDLAVRHYIKIYELEKRHFFSNKRRYELALVKPIDDLRPEEQKFVALIFGGTNLNTITNTDQIGKRLQTKVASFLKTVDKQADADDIYTNRKPVRKQYYKQAIKLAALSLPLLSPGLLLGAIILFFTISALRPLSEKGVRLRDHLKGLKMYMTLAEADRLQVLQSPEGAEKVPAGTDINDTKQLVKLYERLLPYAILYSIEKQWIKQFAVLYQEPPEWYTGNWNTFNAAVFASSISNFNTVSATTFAPPSSSSSSGFSGGSDGGGGGGGGGGW